MMISLFTKQDRERQDRTLAPKIAEERQREKNGYILRVNHNTWIIPPIDKPPLFALLEYQRKHPELLELTEYEELVPIEGADEIEL